MKPRAAARALVFSAVVAILASSAGTLPAGARETIQPVPGVPGLAELWCGPGGVCLAVGAMQTGSYPPTTGAVVVLRAAGPIGPVWPVPAAYNLLDIDCPPVGNCMAVGPGQTHNEATLVELGRDGMPGPARTLPGMTHVYDITCPTATTCLATGVRMASAPTYPYFTMDHLFTVITNGQPAPPQGLPGGVEGDLGIDCPTATTCLVTVNTGFVVLTNANGTWSSVSRELPSRNVNPGPSISCGSSTICYATAEAVVYSGNTFHIYPAIMPVSADGTFGRLRVLTDQPGFAGGISCPAGRNCTVVGYENVGWETTVRRGWTIDVFRGSPSPPSFEPDGVAFRSVSCIAIASCGMVGHGPGGALFAWHGPIPG